MTASVPFPISFLPVDLGRWDHGPGGDALVVSVWSDVRPLRGAAGLLDWRLCGRLSQMIRDGRVSGVSGEKLLLVTGRSAWPRVLAVGLGESSRFDDSAFREAIDRSLETLRRMGARSIAFALPGRDLDVVRPERAMRSLLDVLSQNQEAHGAWLDRLTVIDAASATKIMADASRLTS